MRACLGLILAGALFVSTGSAHAQSIHPVDLDGETVNFVVPDGYCLVDTDRPVEKFMFEKVGANLGPGMELIIWFVRCEHLEKMRLGFDDALFEDYGLYSAGVVPDGGFEHVEHVSRADLLKEVHRQMPSVNIDQIAADVTERTRENMLDPDASVQVLEFGTTGFNEDAVFVTLSTIAQLYGQQVPVSGGGGVTLMNRRIVMVMLYEVTEEPAALLALDARSRRFIADWLDANPDSDN